MIPFLIGIKYLYIKTLGSDNTNYDDGYKVNCFIFITLFTIPIIPIWYKGSYYKLGRYIKPREIKNYHTVVNFLLPMLSVFGIFFILFLFSLAGWGLQQRGRNFTLTHDSSISFLERFRSNTCIGLNGKENNRPRNSHCDENMDLGWSCDKGYEIIVPGIVGMDPYCSCISGKLLCSSSNNSFVKTYFDDKISNTRFLNVDEYNMLVEGRNRYLSDTCSCGS